MEGWLFEPVEALEIVLDEALYAPVAIAVLRPVVDRQHDRDRERIDGGARWDQIWIVVVRERRRQIIIRELRPPVDCNKMHPSLRLELGQEVVRFGAELKDCSNLTGAHLFDCERVVDEDRLDLDAQPFEDHRAGDAWT